MINLSTFYNLNSGLLLKILLIYSIIIDNINGYTQDLEINTPIGILFRGIILSLLIIPVLKRGNGFIKSFFVIITLSYLLCIPLWFLMSGDFNFITELNYFFKLIYFFVITIFFYNNRAQVNIKKSILTIFYSSFYIGLLNIFCFITGIGIKSYGENFGFGTKAFYVDGNSLGLYMCLTIPIMIWYSFKTNKKKYFLMSAIATIGTLLIGSRAAIGGVIISWSIILPYLSIFNDSFISISKSTKFIIFSIGGAIIGVVIYLSVIFITTFDQYTLDKFSSDKIASPREELIKIGTNVINERNDISYIIGEGMSGGVSSMGDVFGGVSIISKSIEADNYDLLLYFGYGFGGLMIVFHFLFFIRIFILPHKKYRNSLTFTLLIIGTLWYFASMMAGHGFYNTSLTPLFAIYVVIAYKFKDKYDFKKNFK